MAKPAGAVSTAEQDLQKNKADILQLANEKNRLSHDPAVRVLPRVAMEKRLSAPTLRRMSPAANSIGFVRRFCSSASNQHREPAPVAVMRQQLGLGITAAQAQRLRGAAYQPPAGSLPNSSML